MRNASLLFTAMVLSCTTEPDVVEGPKLQVSAPLPAGRYDIQTINYDDTDGGYRVFVMGAVPSPYVTTELALQRLSDEEMAAGAKARLDVVDGKPVAVLPTEFAIQTTHAEIEERAGAGGQPEVVVVNHTSSTWSPFAAAMMGSMVGNMLFAPRFYYPPPYVVGRPLLGVGGSGGSLMEAQRGYRSTHGSAPTSARIQQAGGYKVPRSGGVSAGGRGTSSSRVGSGAAKPSSAPRAKPRGSFGGGGFGRRR